MASLKEILAAQKAQKEKANVQQKNTQSQSISEGKAQNVGAISTVQAQSNGTGTGGNIQTNGPVSGQEKSAVPSAGLSLRERLALKGKPNANVPTNEVQRNVETPVQQKENAGVETKNGNSSSAGIVTVEPSQSQPDKHDSKTNDGNIDLENLRNNLAFLAMNIDQVALVGDIVRKIADQLRSNPSLTPYMKDEDVDLVVRGVRRAYNVKVRTATEKKEAKGKKSELDKELGAAFAAAGLNFNLK